MQSGYWKKAQGAIQKGDREGARLALKALILQNPQNEQAWFWMAQLVEDKEQKIDCLERVLQINPNNSTAKQWLERIKPSGDTHTPPFPTAKTTVTPPFVTSQDDESIPADEVYTPPPTPEPADQTPAFWSPPKYTKSDIDLSKDLPRRRPNWSLILGALLVLLITGIAIGGPSLTPSDPLEMSMIVKVGDKYLRTPYPPLTPGYPLGSDYMGRDMLSRLLWGIKPTLTMVLIVAGIRLVLGTTIGLSAGWSNNWLSRVLDTSIAAALSIPVIIIALGGIAAIGVEFGIWAFIFGLCLTGWVETARIVRDQTQAVRSQSYIEAARAMGLSNFGILRGHVLKQILPLLWMLFAFEISATLMLVAALGFLGYYIGGDVWVMVTDTTAAAVSGTPELGQMLATSGASITKPWGLVIVGAVVFTIVLGFNLLGEGLRNQLRLYGKSGSKRTTLAINKIKLGLDEYILWPISNLTRARTFRPAALLITAIVVGGVFIWWWNQYSIPAGDTQLASANHISYTWNNAQGDTQGTRYISTSGPETTNIAWTFTDQSGFSGGPVVAGDGTIYVTSNGDILYALDLQGKVKWQFLLPETPVGTPALGQKGEIYVTDKTGGLAAIQAGGTLDWHYQPQESKSATTGPVAAPEGSIYYVMGSTIQAVSPDGSALWQAQPSSPDTPPTQMVLVSPDGRMIFWGDVVLDAKDGSRMTWNDTSEPYLYFSGADGLTYLLNGHEAAQWQLDDDVITQLEATTWDYSKFTIARIPKEYGVTQDQTVWFYYTGFARSRAMGEDTRVIWLDMDDTILGNAYHPIRNSQVIAVDRDALVYSCGNQNLGYGALECQAFSPEAEGPVWTLALEGDTQVAGGALVPGRLYITTQDGNLHAIGADELITPTQERAQVSSDSSQTDDSSEPKDVHTDDLELAEEPIGPTSPESRLFFEDESGFTGVPVVAPDSTIYIQSFGGQLYALDPDGEIIWQVTLPGTPVGTPAINSDGEVLATDNEGNLSAYSPTGELLWQFQPENPIKAISGPSLGIDGTIYYTGLDKKAKILAVSKVGEGLWTIEVQTTMFYRTPEVSPSGEFIFFRNEIYDAKTGQPMETNLPFEVNEFFGGADGKNYLRSEGTIVAWNHTGTEIILAEERVLSSVGRPSSAGVSAQGTVWMHHTNSLLWFTQDGEALGLSIPEDVFLTHVIDMDDDNTVYVCGRDHPHMLTGKTACYALTPNVDQPAWITIMNDVREDFTGGVLIPGHLYVATEVGHLYIIE
jgi:peptide/nickel transport system permease protein